MFLEKNNNKETAKYQLTKKFISIFLGILFFMNIIYLLASASFVYEFLENKAYGVFETIETQKTTPTNWRDTIDTLVSQKDEDGIIVTTKENSKYFSTHGNELFEELYYGKSLPFVNKIIFSDEGIYYVDERDYGEFSIQLAINSETAVELVYGMLMISLVLNLFALLLGSILIYRSVKGWSLELGEMAQEISELKNSNLLTIKVPERPVEIKEVAIAFNELLENKEASMEREKQFITDASHDLKTPIAAIRGHVQLIQRRGEAHPEIVPKSIAFIDKESLRLEKLSQQLLLLNQDQSPLQKEQVSLTEIILEEVEKNEIIHSRKFELIIEEDVTLYGNQTELQQLVQNILENAIKYSQNGTLIQVKLKNKTQAICFEVVDEGIGISDKQKPAIFERFYRVDSSRGSQVEGSGIGLSIVKKIVDLYSGEIEVKDNQPNGTRFIITMPNMKKTS